ncbi:MAG: methionyl-tRNA formyltransferase [bacterium]|nr:methionyl-tRNA formyltransferase [bacterium]
MKIVFFGTPDFATPFLEVLHNAGIEILSVVTQPNKAIGKSKTLSPTPVKKLAMELGLKVLQPSSKEELKDDLEGFQADFFVIIAYGMILPKEVLKMPKIACINIHASLLPKYRGASPIQEALLNGETETGISIMKMDEKLDHGPIYLVKRINVNEKDNLQSLKEKIANVGKDILVPALEDINDGILIAIPQDEKDQKPSYCTKVSKEDGLIDFKKSAKEIRNMIRAYTPWPGVYTKFNDKNLKILESEISARQLKPGEFRLENKVLEIGTNEGSLVPKKVQLEGKREMDIADFINGNLKHLS